MSNYFHCFLFNLGRNIICQRVFIGRSGTLYHTLSLEKLPPLYPESQVCIGEEFGLEWLGRNSNTSGVMWLLVQPQGRWTLAMLCMGSVLLWKLKVTRGSKLSSGFSFSGASKVTGPSVQEIMRGCLAFCPARKNPCYSYLSQVLSWDVYRSATLALNQVGLISQRTSGGGGTTCESLRGSLQARPGEAGRDLHCWSYLKWKPCR